MNPRLAISSWPFKYPDDLFSVKDTEFRAIESDIDYIPVPLSVERRKQLKTKFQDLGISLRFHLPHTTCDVGSRNVKIREISEKFIQLNIELIKGLGADYAVLHFAQYSDLEIPSLDSLKAVVETASQNGIKLAIENLFYGPTSKPNLLNHISSESGTDIAFDVGHARRIMTTEDFLNLLSSRITHVHFYGFEDDFFNHRTFLSDLEAIETAKILLKETNAEWWTIEMDKLNECQNLFNILKTQIN